MARHSITKSEMVRILKKFGYMPNMTHDKACHEYTWLELKDMYDTMDESLETHYSKVG